MSKGSKIEGEIPKIYKRTSLNLLMYGFVCGVRDALPIVTVKDAVFMFMENFGLDYEDFNESSAAVIIDRMNKEIKDARK